MIVRCWDAMATSAGAQQYEKHFAEVVLPVLRRVDGFRGAYVLRQVENEDLVSLRDMTFWESLSSIRAFAGSHILRAVVDATAQTYLESFDSIVTHYTIAVDAVAGL